MRKGEVDWIVCFRRVTLVAWNGMEWMMRHEEKIKGRDETR
jgi:hypothetical protein